MRLSGPRAWLSVAIVLSPGGLSFALDVLRRPGRIRGFDAIHSAGYAATTIVVAAMWAALLLTAAVRMRRARAMAAGVFATMFALSAGTQHAFFSRYNVYASFDTTYYSDSIPLVLVGSFPRGAAGTALHVAVFAAWAIFLIGCARAFVRPEGPLAKVASAGAAPLVAIVWMMPVSYRVTLQSSAPDAIYFHGVTAYLGERIRAWRWPADPTLIRVQRRSPVPVPAISPKPQAARNVLFILHESQRADVTCIAYDPHCALATPATNALLPDRHPFLQMRAAASSTAVAVSNLWSGLNPMRDYRALHSAPLLWDYASAAGYDTAYWTSQNLLFGNARLFVQDLPLRHSITGSQLDPTADTLVGASDDLLTDHVIARWKDLREPFFAVVHYSNIHRPRRTDPERSPYSPAADVPGYEIAAHNYYKNAVHLSDLSVARLLRHVLPTESGRRTVIVYTSDHGESLAEHDNEIEHSSTVFDEEIHVPTWIHAPEGTLSPTERKSLAGKRDAYLVQYDIGATILDLLGVWDAPEMAPFRREMIGLPLTRPELPTWPVPLTNVSWVWEYRYPNWGMMLGSKKVVALAGDERYRCYDVASDPGERHDLGEAACGDLVGAARATFRILPREMPGHMRSRPDIWGPWPP